MQIAPDGGKFVGKAVDAVDGRHCLLSRDLRC